MDAGTIEVQATTLLFHFIADVSQSLVYGMFTRLRPSRSIQLMTQIFFFRHICDFLSYLHVSAFVRVTLMHGRAC